MYVLHAPPEPVLVNIIIYGKHRICFLTQFFFKLQRTNILNENYNDLPDHTPCIFVASIYVRKILNFTHCLNGTERNVSLLKENNPRIELKP